MIANVKSWHPVHPLEGTRRGKPSSAAGRRVTLAAISAAMSYHSSGRILPGLFLIVAAASSNCPGAEPGTVTLRGEIVDAQTGRPLPARLYIEREDGRWFFARSASAAGSAVRYDKRNWINTNAAEMHVTLSAHPFVADLPPGRYTLTVERGKEYLSLTNVVEVKSVPVEVRLPLRRWVDMAGRGWFSGDTHVHRTVDELPNVMLAEDLNVAFPLTYWVTKAFAPPAQGDKNSAAADARLIEVDQTHVIWPRNTEYEIFTVNGPRHTLGAVFVLNHQSVLDLGAPPVKPIAARARAEGALLDLDKHNWPWSLALVPTMGVDLFELSNNHVWRTHFAFTNWASGAPAYMGLDYDGQHGTEHGWVHFGLQTWYALLNCGFRLRPTGGTASGVHPVPLGFGRVYVYCPSGFSYESWLNGLNEGRSFVTTGPMLLAQVNGKQPGHVFALRNRPTHAFNVTGRTYSERPLTDIEILVNGGVAKRLRPENTPMPGGGYENAISARVELNGSGWIAARCFEHRPEGRFRFAHTAPFHIEVENRPLRPRKVEVDFLAGAVETELERSRSVLPPEAIAEYEEALASYRKLGGNAR
jgi:hypothetical protein